MKRISAILLISLTVLTPYMAIVPGLPKIRGEDYLLIVLLLCGIIKYISGSLKGLPNKITTSFIFMWFMAMISICSGYIIYGNEVIVNDMMIIPMLIKYWIVFRFAQIIFENSNRRVVLIVAAMSISIAGIVGILQYHNLFDINEWLTPLYISEHAKMIGLELLIQGSIEGRVAGTSDDPRHFGYLLVVGFVLCISLAVHGKTMRDRICVIIMLVPCLLSIIYTQTRTATLSVALLTLISIIMIRATMLSRTKLVFLVVLIGATALYIGNWYGIEGFRQRVLDTDTYGESMAPRERDLIQPFSDALEHPAIFLFGRGPSKSEMRTDSHNDYGWYFHRFGLPGLAFYILILFWGAKQAIRMYRRAVSRYDKNVSMASFLIIVNWMFYAMAENIFKDPQLMVINMFFVGLIYSESHLKRNKARKVASSVN